jgi:hypothetical protein
MTRVDFAVLDTECVWAVTVSSHKDHLGGEIYHYQYQPLDGDLSSVQEEPLQVAVQLDGCLNPQLWDRDQVGGAVALLMMFAASFDLTD